MEDISNLVRKIEELETANNELRKWQGSINQLISKMMEVVSLQGDSQRSEKERLDNLELFSRINRYRIDSLPYELQDPDYKSFFFKPKILSISETRERVIRDNCSIARFGDGEFAAIVGQKRWNFQGESKVLSEKLKEVLRSDDEGMLVGLNPNFYINLFDLPENDADGVRAYMRPMVRRLHAELLRTDKEYANAIFHKLDSDRDVMEVKQIWNNRDCVFIEGVHTCMGVGNDLFDNCKSIERILCPAENAVEKYDEIIGEALKQPKNKLVLAALGPTATILAYDLYKEGYQAVDIGHIDLVYEAHIRKLTNLYEVDIPYKYCSKDERISGRIIEKVEDPLYMSQVVAKI